MMDSQCAICRRAGVKLFLKGERCYTPKCAIVRRNYTPGIKGKRRPSRPSDFSRQLREKQKLRFWYGLSEKELRRTVQEILAHSKGKDPALLLIQRLESRLDNVIFRTGLFASRRAARQAVSHGFFKIGGQKVDIPSYRVRKGEEIQLSPTKAKKKIFQNLAQALKKQKLPVWLRFDAQNLTTKTAEDPVSEAGSLPVEIPSVFEFYSR